LTRARTRLHSQIEALLVNMAPAALLWFRHIAQGQIGRQQPFDDPHRVSEIRLPPFGAGVRSGLRQVQLEMSFQR